MTAEQVPLLAMGLLLGLAGGLLLVMPGPLHWGRQGAVRPMSPTSQRSFAWLLLVAAVAFGAQAVAWSTVALAARVLLAPSAAWLAFCAWRDGRPS